MIAARQTDGAPPATAHRRARGIAVAHRQVLTLIAGHRPNGLKTDHRRRTRKS